MLWKLFKPRAKTAPTPEKPRGDYHAVQIASGAVACEAVCSIAGMRFLSREGPPRVPLKNCSIPEQCTCRYLHHADRRHEVRRNSDHAWGPADHLPPERERRRSPGRRATDLRRD